MTKTWLTLNVSTFTSLKGRCNVSKHDKEQILLSCLKQEEVDVFKIGFKVVGESADGGKTIIRTVGLVRSITSPQKLGKLPLLCRKAIWIKPGSIFKKCATDYEEIRDRLWEYLPPTLGKSVTMFRKSHKLWEKSATDFGKICHRFCQAPFSGKIISVFG